MNHSQARSVASSLWGTPDASQPTNRAQCFWFDTPSHGGFIIDGRALTEPERSAISRFLNPEIGHAIVDTPSGKTCKFRSPFSRRTLRYNYGSQHCEEVHLFIGEEDCAWSVITHLTGISISPEMTQRAEETFNKWYAK